MPLLEAFCYTPAKFDFRRDLASFLLILISFAIGLGLSWERWGNPVVDSGRELNVPLRLVHGEMLYSDVHYLYGPLSPYLNALLYRVFHPSLWVLWGHGIFCAITVLALTYWLARQIMDRFSAVLACLLFTWVCVLKSQGNYMLAYSYGALDGSMFVLATTAALVVGFRRRSTGWLFAAGVIAALATLSKTELGLAALIAGAVTAILTGYACQQRLLRWLLAFLVPALAIPAIIFEWFASQVGWQALTVDNHLFFGHVPWQLRYFNGFRFGFGHPWHSLGLIVASTIRLVALGGLVASVAVLIVNRGKTPTVGTTRSWSSKKAAALLAISVAIIALTSAVMSDMGPLMAMPLILFGLGVGAAAMFARAARQGDSCRDVAGTTAILAASALACLPRILLRVSTGGALSSFLLPLSVVLFVYVWVEIFPSFIGAPGVHRLAKQIVSAILVIGLLVTAVTVSVRYRKKFTYGWVTPRGTWITPPEQGIAFTQALRFVEGKTVPGDSIAVLPEGTSLDFVSNRRNPLRDEIITPGFLDDAGERQAIEDLRRARAPLVLIANRATPEFAQVAFGRDYNQRLMSWIERNYVFCGVFGPRQDANLQVGDPTFFLRAYCLSNSPVLEH